MADASARIVAALALAALLVGVRPLRAQDSTTTAGWSLDRLRVQSLGVFAGRIDPSQLEATTLGGLTADYGEIHPHWHLIFGFSFWQSQFRNDVVQAFVDTLQKSVVDSTGNAHVAASSIPLYDATIGLEARYAPRPSGVVSPFLGVGMAAHVINADGPLIQGTFVERALDNIAGGFFLDAGAAIRIVRHIGVEASVRGDLLSGFRSTQVRAGATYYFGGVRAPAPQR